MKQTIPYKPFENFVLRTPLFPYNYLQKEELMMNSNAFLEALFIASPELSDEISKHKRMPETPRKEERRAVFSSFRYYQRACTRPTPFGLFAGCSLGILGEQTKIQLTDQQLYKRITRLDMNYLCALTQQIEKDKRIREQLRYYLNDSIYPIGSKLRYVEYHYSKAQRSHKISQVDYSDYIWIVLNKAQIGASFSELTEALIDDEITKEDAANFIHELIDVQLLISELAPAVTNVKPLTSLIEKLNGLSFTDEQLCGILSTTEMQLALIDSQPIGNSVPIYYSIIKNIKATKLETEIKYLFQTDMYKPVQHANVSKRLIRDIQQTLVFLNKITPSSIGNINLSTFKENFLKRYNDREMPLLFVLDNELGIGYAENTSGDISPLVDDLVMPHSNSPSVTSQASIPSILQQRGQQFSQNIIELTDEDVKGLESAWNDLPPTFSVLCQLLQDNEQGRSFYIQSVGGHSGANFLGRFCHLDEEILNHTLTITEKEKQMNPDVIFAEIVHLPESRIANILLRPVLRQYEIPYLARSSVSNQFELRPDDLLILVKNNRIQLRSKRLNKIIVPRMSTAHNYSGATAMPVYQFLCDLQNQDGRTRLMFRWDDYAQQLDFLPRIIYKNCILSKARWKVSRKAIEPFARIKNDNELLQKIKVWQTGRNIPNQVLLNDGDNKLYVDMNNPLSIQSWLSIVKKRSIFQLEEFLFDPDTAVVHSSEGVFTNEFIFTFYRSDNDEKQ